MLSLYTWISKGAAIVPLCMDGTVEEAQQFNGPLHKGSLMYPCITELKYSVNLDVFFNCVWWKALHAHYNTGMHTWSPWEMEIVMQDINAIHYLSYIWEMWQGGKRTIFLGRHVESNLTMQNHKNRQNGWIPLISKPRETLESHFLRASVFWLCKCQPKSITESLSIYGREGDGGRILLAS